MDRWRILDIEQNRRSESEKPDQEARKRSEKSVQVGERGTGALLSEPRT